MSSDARCNENGIEIGGNHAEIRISTVGQSARVPVDNARRRRPCVAREAVVCIIGELLSTEIADDRQTGPGWRADGRGGLAIVVTVSCCCGCNRIETARCRTLLSRWTDGRETI